MLMKKNTDAQVIEETWRMFLTTGGNEAEHRNRRFFRRLPGSHRCKICYAPFRGASSKIVQLLYKKTQSNLNPYLCNTCEMFARKYQGGVEIELSLLFADVRGSTTLAENMSPVEFHKLINRFYSVATQVLADSGALIDKIIGDQAAGMYVPGLAGQQHALRAVEAAKAILIKTGHKDPAGPWIPLGIGVHTGNAFVGSVGSENGTSDITVLGDTANVAARLSTSAGIGEILISESSYQRADFSSFDRHEQREIELKGKTNKMLVNIISSY
jgi:adenylate cyclase